MANTNLFQTIAGKLLPKTDARNNEKAPAYAFSAEHGLAQYAATGCLNATFYASAEEQLGKVLDFASQASPEFVAKTAIYAREKGYMKDMPALLCAVLSVRDKALLAKVFPRVIDNGRMLRNFVQIIRSGQVGRKSLGSLPKRLVAEWINARSDDQLFGDTVGQSPSIEDIIKMVHPRPANKAREAFYAYLIDREYDAALLPEKVKQFESFKMGETKQLPDVSFQLLTGLDLQPGHWVEIARKGSWQMTRMNLNTFARHGVFDSNGMVKLIASRLADRDLVRKARVFPYQLMTAYSMADEAIPVAIREALQDAMEIATENTPRIEGKVYIFPDVSGSMQSPVTGVRRGATSKVRCIDVAALVAATIMRRNPDANVLPFGTDVCKVGLNPRDSIMTNAQKMAAIAGGGTNCSAPLVWLNKQKAKGDLIIYVSDNESWVDAGKGRGTATMAEWSSFQKRNPKAKMVCIDIQPYATTQATERTDIMNVGGFSDQVFDLIAKFASGEMSPAHWIGEIEKVNL